MANPARIMVLTVVPRQLSTMAAASSDSGMATTLISATRQEYRKMNSMKIISRQPMSSELLRFLSEVSMKLAGRKMVVSISRPGRPGLSDSMASSTPRVTSRVLAHGSFSTIIMRPGPGSKPAPFPTPMTASPTIGGPVSTTLATSASLIGG